MTRTRSAIRVLARGATRFRHGDVKQPRPDPPLDRLSADMDIDIPFLLRPSRDKALGAMQREIATWVGKAERGEV